MFSVKEFDALSRTTNELTAVHKNGKKLFV